jgi:hypothetical protein
MEATLIKDAKNAHIFDHCILMILSKEDLKYIGWVDKSEVKEESFLSNTSSDFKEIYSKKSWTHFAYIDRETNKLISATVIKIKK